MRALALMAALSCIPATVHAQKVLVGLQLYDLASGRLEWTAPGGLGLGGVVFTADGRYIVTVSMTSATPALRVIDAVNGSWLDVPMSFEPRIAHPRAGAVYGLTGGELQLGAMARGTLARVDATGLSTYGGCAPGTATIVDLSGDGRLLFELCESGDLAVLDADSGAVLRTLPLGQGVTFAATFDGTALVVARPTLGGAVELLDSTTGVVLGSTPAPASPCAPVVTRPSLDRTTAILSCVWPGAPLPTWSSHVLSVPGLTWGAELVGSTLQVASVSPDNRTAFSSYRHRTGAFGNLQINDLTSGAVTAWVPIIASIAVSYAPLPPTASSTVTGRQVDLSWTLPAASPAVTGYVVEVGSAPGLADLATISVGAQPTLTVPSAPPGRYYVRVRAENASGVSAPSGEIVVDVS